VKSVGGREQVAPAPAAVPSRTPAATLARRAGVILVAAAVLFFCYLRQSQLAPVSSDGSGNILQAWDMLHGNLLLTHWWVSDVSFFTTELPQYMLIEAVLGLGPWVVHVAAAMTYTLLVLLAGVLAKGHATGRAGWARALLAGGLMVAPQLSATSIVLLSPDHTGTAVPLLVTWLLIDRARPRWFIPVLVCLLLTLTMVADVVVLVTGIIPLMLTAAVRAFPGLISRGKRPQWYELSLAGAAAVAGVAGSFAPRAIAALGGYRQSNVGTATDLGQLGHGAWVTVQAFLELFGASFSSPRPGPEVVFVALHLAGAAAVACVLILAFTRFFRADDLMVPVFAVAIVLNMVAYMTSTHAQNLLSAREVAAVLPLGAVLAGRLLGDRLLGWTRAARKWLAPALAVLTVGYLAGLGYNLVQAPVASQTEPLAAWLVTHRLTDGLASYWQANSTTVDSHGRVLVTAVVRDPRDRLVPYQWEADDANYDPARHYANFVVVGGFDTLPAMPLSAELTFGRPARVYHASGYTIMVWNTNLLTELNRPGPD
jgi:hypothetical protein